MKVSDNRSVCDCNIFYLTETQKLKIHRTVQRATRSLFNCDKNTRNICKNTEEHIHLKSIQSVCYAARERAFIWFGSQYRRWYARLA
jgi:hypothetical protein